MEGKVINKCLIFVWEWFIILYSLNMCVGQQCVNDVEYDNTHIYKILKVHKTTWTDNIKSNGTLTCLKTCFLPHFLSKIC